MNNIDKNLLDITTAKELVIALMICGGTVIATAIAPALISAAIPIAIAIQKKDKKKHLKFQKTLWYLRKTGIVDIQHYNGQIHISLTKKGESRAINWKKILSMKKPDLPARWDRKWRILMFDISSSKRIKRDALRHLIKKLGMVQMQKSVWIHPFDCTEQVHFLKRFLDLNDTEVRLIVTESVGNDKPFRRKFNLN